jgi:hypothetical protein
MKKFKMHLISIFIIIFMLVFALGTSVAPVSTQLTVVNYSSKDLMFRIARQEEDIIYIEEFLLRKEQSIDLKEYITYKYWTAPDEYLLYFIIYNENMEIIKEYNNKIDSKMLKKLFSNLEKSGGGRASHFTLRIADELLE